MRHKRILSMVCLSGLALQLFAAESAAPAGTGSPAPEAAAPQPVTADQIKQLQERIAEQEEQIRRLQQSVEQQRLMVEGALKNVTSPASASVVNTANSGSGTPVQFVPAVNTWDKNANVVPSGRAGQKSLMAASPLSISIGDTTFTPLGFVDFTFVGRSTNVGSGIGTSFGAIPLNNSAKGRIAENNLTTQNSRLGFRVDGNYMGAKVLGYFEADFLGQQGPNVFVTSNADTFRMRNVFVDVQKNGIEILGGQDWTLMTPNRKGLSPIPGDIFFSQDIDTNYQAGLVWARQSQLRIIAHPNDNVAFGVSLENPQQYVGNGLVTYPAALSGLSTQFNDTTTNYSVPNLHPDIIFKAAYDGHAGKKLMHVEAGALIRSFKFVNPTTFGTSTATAVSGEVNTNLEVVKNVKLIANTFFGSGGGRYIYGLGPDVVIRANGEISPVKAYSTVDGFEAQVSKNTLISLLYGGAYFGKNAAIDTTGKFIGFGYPGASSAGNRNVQEVTFDINRTLWKNANYGALNLMGQYSYLWRDPWTIAAGGPKNARASLYYLNLRYTLP